jgi:hypothetical protein
LTPNPILKVLSTLRSHRVRFLVMGGQACVLYGAAEFSRDTDIAILANIPNLRRLSAALRELQAQRIAVPPLAIRHLKKGHAVHFRCRHRDADGIWLDVMSVLRGVASFPALWRRRTTVEIAPDETYDLLALPDLVHAKKTQRDKDWPMLRRFVEAHYAQNRRAPSAQHVRFWLAEARTPSILIELARKYPRQIRRAGGGRPLLRLAVKGGEQDVEAALAEEERCERELDRAYWAPLRAELERMRHRHSRRKRLAEPKSRRLKSRATKR